MQRKRRRIGFRSTSFGSIRISSRTTSTARSSKRPDTSPSPKRRSISPACRVRPRNRSRRDRWCSRRPRGPSICGNSHAWWTYVVGASWRNPQGPHSSIDALGDHPVVHVAYEDALAYAEWAGKALATKLSGSSPRAAGSKARISYGATRWSRAGSPRQHVARRVPVAARRRSDSSAPRPSDRFRPTATGSSTWPGTCGNGRRLVRPHGRGRPEKHAAPHRRRRSYDPTQPAIRIPRKVLKGGSHLCAPSYCMRFRPAARMPQMIDTGMSHIGFRCVKRSIEELVA